jgi:hypothetical protein
MYTRRRRYEIAGSTDLGSARSGYNGIEHIVAEGKSQSGAESNGGALEDGTDAKSVGRSESRENALGGAKELDAGESSLRRVVDTIPALAWCARPDGSMEFLNCPC